MKLSTIFFNLLAVVGWLFCMKFIWGAFLFSENGSYCEYFNNYGEILIELIVVTIVFIFMIIYIVKNRKEG